MVNLLYELRLFIHINNQIIETIIFYKKITYEYVFLLSYK
jgi:hypothetical protein